MALRLTTFNFQAPGYHPHVCFTNNTNCLPGRTFNFSCIGNPSDILYIEYSIAVNSTPPVMLTDFNNGVPFLKYSFNIDVLMGSVTDNFPVCFYNDGHERGNDEMVIMVRAWTATHPESVFKRYFNVSIC